MQHINSTPSRLDFVVYSNDWTQWTRAQATILALQRIACRGVAGDFIMVNPTKNRMENLEIS